MTLPYQLANTLFDARPDPNTIVVGRSFYYADASTRFANAPNASSLVEYDEDAVAGQIEMVIGTLLGTEEFEPTFGSVVLRRLFDNITTRNLADLELEAMDALRTWLGARLDFISVSTSKDNTTGDVYVLIPYRIKVSGEKQTYLGNLTAMAKG